MQAVRNEKNANKTARCKNDNAACMGKGERKSKYSAADEMGQKVYAQRKETVERSFADAKQHYGHRYARFRGQMKVQMQCLLAATAQNMRKMALLALLCLLFILQCSYLRGVVIKNGGQKAVLEG